MRFKAIEQETKPYITWLSTDEPLGALVVEEENIPAFIFGVCPWKIVDGELVERTSGELAVFEAEWNAQQALQNQMNKTEILESSQFAYNGNDFPLNELAIIRYRAIESDDPANYAVMDMVGVVVNLTSADTPDFIDELNKVILGITSP